MSAHRAVRLRWDWLRASMVVPYVPTIGPVHPDALAEQLFVDVIAVAGTGRFLGYDKDRRWFKAKSETVLVDSIAYGPDQTLVPTWSWRAAPMVSVYMYGSAVDGHEAAVELAVKLCAVNRVDDARIVWFVGPDEAAPPGDHVTRVQLCRLDVHQLTGAADNVWPLAECPPRVKATFPNFAESLADEGFAFLKDLVETAAVGPVLVAVDDGHVVGAIGPLEIMADPAGRPRFLPPYFAVLPECRRRGFGRALWRAAMHWGHGTGATYQLIQTEIGGASDHLCAAEGLRPLGFVGVTNI